MTILDALLHGVSVAGNVLDTPGALVRNTLSGRDPFAGLNPLDADGRASGRDMLESWGMLDANQEGLDWGDAAGFGAELLTDPLNFLGAGAAKNTARLAKEAKAANASSYAMRASGAMPEEIARLTKIVDESGDLVTVHHGHPPSRGPASITELDPSYAGSNTDAGFYGKGTYTTPQRVYAESYAGQNSVGVANGVQPGGRVLSGYADIRNPFISDSLGNKEEFISTLPASVQESLADRAKSLSKVTDWTGSRIPEQVDTAYRATLLDRGATAQMADILSSPSSPIDSLNFSSDVTSLLRSLGYDGVINTLPGNTQSWAHPGTLSEVVVFDRGQLYEPIVAPRLQTAPSMSPILAALFGHNALARGSQF